MRARGRNDSLTAALWLAALALLLRALVPGGFMPVPAASGSGVVLMPCPGTAPEVAGLAPGQSHKREGKAPRSADALPCAFAGIASLAIAPAPAPEPVLPAAWRVPDSVRVPAATVVAGRMSSPPPPSQGPPQAIA